MRNSREGWQVETQGQIYEADLEELKQWISEGAVLFSDKVKRGNLRWLPVEKVPELSHFFNSKDFDEATNNFAENEKTGEIVAARENTTEEPIWEINGEKVCFLHTDKPADYACAICKKLFCKICPNSFGASVKICPLCGALCRSADEAQDKRKVIGAVSKPYYKINESPNRSEGEKRAASPVPGFSQIFTHSLQTGKNLISRLVSFARSRSSGTRR